MNNIPCVSIITVCRNVGDAIGDTIESILQQTYPNIELILIDGASTDNTVEVIKRYDDKLAYWVSEPDKGIYDAMNKGLRHATGEWVNFMNVGDSFSDANVLSSIFGDKEIPENIRLIGGNTNNFFPDGHIEVHHAEPAKNIKYRIPFSHQSCFTRRELEKGNGAFQFDLRYKIAADYNLFYNIYYKYGVEAIKVVDLSIANYKQEGSTSLINYRAAKKDYLRIQSAHPNIHWLKELIKYCIGKK